MNGCPLERRTLRRIETRLKDRRYKWRVFWNICCFRGNALESTKSGNLPNPIPSAVQPTSNMLKATRFLTPGSIQSFARYNKTPSFKVSLVKGLEHCSSVRGVSSLSKQNLGLSALSNDEIVEEIEKALLNSEPHELAPGMDLPTRENMHWDIEAAKLEHLDLKHPDPLTGQLHANNIAPGSLIRANANAGDPLGCDSTDMRTAKARSQYAWVSDQGEL